MSVPDNIYLAAKDGMALALYSLLSNIPHEDFRSHFIDHAYPDVNDQYFTPLTIASRNGHYETVAMLLKYSPNLEEESTVNFEHNIIQGATALWCAAGSGHLNVVKLLVRNGADVNHATKSQSTALRAACFDGRLDIVQYLVAHNADINLANGYNNTCLMVAAYKGHTDIVEFLLNNKACPNEQAHCGATALHYAAEYGHVNICRILLKFGAELKKNGIGMTPVITAAERTREHIVNLFCEEPDLLTKMQKIDALELLGASYANDKDNYSIMEAYRYLEMGMELRYSDEHDVVHKKKLTPIPAYDDWIESQTMQDLQAIRYNQNSIHMEALTIRERILTRKCPDVAHPIVYRGAVCADNGRFDRCEILWLHALNLRQDINLSVQRDLLRFAQVFSQMIQLGVNLRLRNVLTVFVICVKELQQNIDLLNNPGLKDDVQSIMREYELNIYTSLYFCTIIAKLLKGDESEDAVSNDEIASILIKTLVKLNVRTSNDQTLLHLAVSAITPIDKFHINDVCKFPCVDTVKLLLTCGAKVTVFDHVRNTPLHTLVRTQPSVNIDEINELLDIVASIIELFIKYGLHIDSVNEYNRTPSQEAKSMQLKQLIRRYEINTSTLKCLASKCITKHGLSYKESVPKTLETFIEQHMITTRSSSFHYK